MKQYDEPIILPVPHMSAPQENAPTKSYSDAPLHRYPRWAPRFWHGMDFFTWARLLVRNRFNVAPVRLSMVATVTMSSILNSFSSVIERVLFSHRIRKAKLTE